MQIENRLNALFEKYRVIFWYDEEKEYENVIDKLNINAKILKVNNNEFGIKVEVLTNKDKNYLIYATKKPHLKDNWLADLLLANYEFKADKVSEIIEELGIDLSFREFIKRYKKFFTSKRIKKFKELVEKEDEDDFILSMLAILLKSEKKFDYILLETINKGVSELEKFSLDKELFRLIEKEFNIKSKSIDEFLIKLFLNAFEDKLNNNAKVFIKFWSENLAFNELLKEKIIEIEEKLNIKDKLDLNKAMNCKLFRECERFIIDYILLNFDKISLDLIENRRDALFFSEYENLYNALIYAKKLLDSKFNKKFSFSDFIDYYISFAFKIDYFYRKYYFFRDKSENIEALKDIDERIEKFYLEFLRINDEFNKYLDSYKIDNKHQRNFYKNLPNKRVFVIISDALRFECGVELAKRVKNLNKFEVEVNYMISSLPSYTYLGMASLLPHKEIEVKEKVFIDGMNSVGVINRDKILKKYNPKSMAINIEDFLKIKASDGKNIFKEYEIIYIYHNEIDKMGENDESNVFLAVESAIETLIKTIKQIRNFNGVNIYITSDHGFLFTNTTQRSEYCPKPEGDFILLNRRFAIGKIKEKSCGIVFDSKRFNIKCEGEFLIAKSINRFAIQGGGSRYIHGGATLQEIIIPLIKINYKKKDVIKEVDILIPQINRISTNIIKLNFYQKEVVNDKTSPVTLKTYFEKDGEILSDIHTIEFREKDEYSENREKKVTFTFKSNIQKFNNQNINFIIEKKQGNIFIPYKKEEVKVNISFFAEEF